MTDKQISAPRFDVIIVGAGPNGMALALALAGQAAQPQARVLLVDGRDPQSFVQSGHDTRGTALTRATQNMFRALGVWHELKDHVAEMRDIIVSDGAGAHDLRPALLSFATPQGVKPAAVIAENRHIAAALVGKVMDTRGITLKTGAAVTAITTGGGFAALQFGDGTKQKSPLIVGADGRNSFVRQQSGIMCKRHDDGQAALSFSVHHDLPHDGRAEEHFSPDGVFALLPLPGLRSSVVWGTTAAEAARLMALGVNDFEDVLNARVGHHLGRLRVDGAKQSFPLVRQVADSFTAPRTALIGDAAHAIHPLAGLGLNLGFKDAAILAACVGEAMLRGEDHGGPAMLERYERWRRFDVASTMAAMEGMNSLFGNDVPVLRLLRQAGLRLVDAAPTLKQSLMNEASGLTGALPPLMREN